MVTIIFEAHSTSYDNEHHVSSGHNDVELSPLGIQQSKELGERYKDEHFDAIFCSDLQRSYKTAEVAFGNRFSIIKDARLRECDYGDLTQHPSEEVDKEKPKRIHTPFPNGESYTQTNARMLSFLDDLTKDYEGKKVMIIGHRATQYGLEQWINGVYALTSITTPWKWQPGWTYYLYSVPAPYGFTFSYVVLPYKMTGLAPQFEALGRKWFVKQEFHVSLLGVNNFVPKLTQKFHNDPVATKSAIMEAAVAGLEKFQPSFGGFRDEFRLVKKGDAETIVQMCDVNQLKEFFDFLSADLDIKLELPPTHITLYTLANRQAIGLHAEEDITQFTRRLTPEETKEVQPKMKQAVTITRATFDDVKGIRQVQKTGWLTTYPNKEHNITTEDILSKDFDSEAKIARGRQLMLDPVRRIWVAKDSDRVVGFINASLGDAHNKLEALYILPEYQGQGIGKRLMQEALDFLGRDKPIVLGVVPYNTRAINFYKRYGFIEREEIVHDEPTFPNGKNMPEIEMTWTPPKPNTD